MQCIFSKQTFALFLVLKFGLNGDDPKSVMHTQVVSECKTGKAAAVYSL